MKVITRILIPMGIIGQKPMHNYFAKVFNPIIVVVAIIIIILIIITNLAEVNICHPHYNFFPSLLSLAFDLIAKV